jgi:hypothetical protein
MDKIDQNFRNWEIPSADKEIAKRKFENDILEKIVRCK